MMKCRLLFFLFIFSGVTVFSQNNFLEEIDKIFLTGKIDNCIDSRFVEVNKEFSFRQIYLNASVYDAFLEMARAAKLEGIHLKIISGTRSFEEQKKSGKKSG